MAYDKLICPQCSFPLSAAPSQTQVCCPRCSTWLDIEQKCTGACLSCHAAKKAEATGSCADLSDAVPVSIERSSNSVVSKADPAKSEADKVSLKALIKRLFEV